MSVEICSVYDLGSKL